MFNPSDFLLKAYALGIIKFGDFTLKSGLKSPFYVDLRPLASSPELLKTLSNALLSRVEDAKFELICGVPYSALPMATVMSLVSGTPLIIKRKENKGYGTKRMVEGVFQSGQECLLVEDVITSGKSLLETIDELNREGIQVSTIVVVLDREQGGVEYLQKKGYRVEALFGIRQTIQVLQEAGKLLPNQAEEIYHFLDHPAVLPKSEKRKTYQEKLADVQHPVAQKLLKIAIQKQSNIILAADVEQAEQVLKLACEAGEHIAALKLHADIIEDFSLEFIHQLEGIAKEKNFLLFEDRKFADIGNTQLLQYNAGTTKISSWADMITAHFIAGKKSLQPFEKTGVVGILEMSSEGTLTDEHYISKALEIALSSPQVFALVAQRRVPPSFILMTPGVHIESSGDAVGQVYHTPEEVFVNYHTDFAIVGRGIYQDAHPEIKARQYRERCWNAYEKSLDH